MFSISRFFFLRQWQGYTSDTVSLPVCTSGVSWKSVSSVQIMIPTGTLTRVHALDNVRPFLLRPKFLTPTQAPRPRVKP